MAVRCTYKGKHSWGKFYRENALRELSVEDFIVRGELVRWLLYEFDNYMLVRVTGTNGGVTYACLLPGSVIPGAKVLQMQTLIL